MGGLYHSAAVPVTQSSHPQRQLTNAQVMSGELDPILPLAEVPPGRLGLAQSSHRLFKVGPQLSATKQSMLGPLIGQFGFCSRPRNVCL